MSQHDNQLAARIADLERRLTRSETSHHVLTIAVAAILEPIERRLAELERDRDRRESCEQEQNERG